MAHVAAEIIWIQFLLKELGISYYTPNLYCDNLGTVALSHNQCCILALNTWNLTCTLFEIKLFLKTLLFSLF
uniref:Retrovirus-related Pol polyprotein from transposon TNT 1-94 n=1 Tax=Cajanus cajan TaxID=3821 RepID=A0A151SW16_CAJCA|nr:hypothetical protein KK1_014411 [Cajanus cajan]